MSVLSNLLRDEEELSDKTLQDQRVVTEVSVKSAALDESPQLGQLSRKTMRGLGCCFDGEANNFLFQTAGRELVSLSSDLVF